MGSLFGAAPVLYLFQSEGLIHGTEQNARLLLLEQALWALSQSTLFLLVMTLLFTTEHQKAQKLSRWAHAAESVADAAKDADVVFIMVGYPTDVEDVYLATDGLIRVATWVLTY